MTDEEGIFETISIDEVIAACKIELNLFDTTLQDGYIENAIYIAMGKMRNFFTHTQMIAQIPIDLTTLSAPIPLGFAQTNGEQPIRTFSELPTVIPPNNTVNNYGNFPSVPNRSGFFKGTLNISYSAQIDNGYIWFGSDTTDTYCQLAYRGINLDANGDMAIPSTALMMLQNYACATYSRSRGDKSLYPSYINDFYNERRRLRGVYNKSTNEQIANVMNKFFVRNTGGYCWY
jgi:hypothetical protein